MLQFNIKNLIYLLNILPKYKNTLDQESEREFKTK